MVKNKYIPIYMLCAFILGLTSAALSQDWVHPNNRYKFAGYEKHKEQKRNSPIWTYATNRPGGNTKGGGTTEYQDYQPNYRPPFQFNKYTYKRPQKTGDEEKDPCNCNK